MKRYAGYAALLIGAWLVFLVARFPAAHALHWAQQSGVVLPVALYQVDGSVWSGAAQAATRGGQPLGRVDWAFRPQALALGRIEFGLEVVRDSGRLDATAGRSFGGELYLRDARAALPLNDAAMIAGQPDMGLTGRVDAEFRRIALGARGIAAIDGEAGITGVGIGPPVGVTLGNFMIGFETADEVIRGTLKDTEGPLRADGVVLLNPDGNWRLNASLGARDPGNTQLAQALAMIGRPDRNGRVTVTQQGRIVLPPR